MTRKLTLLAVLICTVFTAFSQNFKVTWGPEYKKEGGMWSIDYLLGNDDKYFYALSDPRGKPKVLKFDYTGKLVTSTPVTFDVGKTKAHVGGMVRMAERTFLIFVARDKKAGVVNFYYTELKNGTFSTTPKNFYAIPFSYNFGKGLALGYGFSSLDASETGDFEVSENGKYLTVVGSQIGAGKEEVIKAAVFDDNLKLVWEKTFPMKISDRNIYIEQFIVNNNGDVFVSAKQWDSKDAYKKNMPKYRYVVYKLTSGGLTETTIDLGSDKAPWDAGLFPATEGGGVYVGGFYTKTTTSKGSADGVFFSDVNAGGKAKSNSYPFTDEFLKGLQTKKQEKKDEGITSFYIDYLMRLPDGSFTFIAEKYFVVTHTVSDGKGGFTTYYTYHTNEIVIPRFGADGSLISLDKIDKTFGHRSPMLVSYSFFVKDNSVVLVFNDFKTKEERKESGKGKAIYTDICYVPGNGTVDTKNIFTSKDVEKYYIPGQALDLGNGKHVVKAIKGKTYQYGVITP